MTTKAAENLYLAPHLYSVEGRNYAIYNPHDRPINELPIIYGFNNGGRRESLMGILLSEDGDHLGDHMCSHEGYMTHDLGILEGSRPDRHETFRTHYPEGYRMDFIGGNEVDDHDGLAKAEEKYMQKKKSS